MFLLLVLHVVVRIGIVAGGGVFGRHAFLVASVAPLATVIWVATKASDVLDDRPVTESYAWIEQLGISIDLRLDAFALVMVALVSGIGVLICVYSLGYLSHDQPGLARLAGLLTLFAGAMLGVVRSDYLIALFVFWELTSITSFLLTGNATCSASPTSTRCVATSFGSNVSSCVRDQGTARGTRTCRRSMAGATGRRLAGRDVDDRGRFAMTGFASVLLAIGAAGFLFRLLRGPSLADRVVGLDGLQSIVVIAIVVSAARSDSGITIETVLVAVLVGFVGTTALSRFIERRGN